MPDERRYNDAEVDEVGLLTTPQAQSGNLDKGHIDARVAELTGEQRQDLLTISQNYFDGQLNYVQLEQSLTDEGYSEQQITTLSNAFHAELAYRNQHSGTPSNLTPNQITYLYNNLGRGIGAAFIQYDDNGNAIGYTSPLVGREEGGTPILAPLPAPIPIEVLTQAQQDQIATLRQIQPILDQHLANNQANVPASRRRDNLNSFDRLQIDEALSHYFNGQTDLIQFTNELSTMIGIEEVNNNEQILGTIIQDAILEKDYRDNNDGRPQVLSQQQYDYIRENPLQQYFQVLSGERGTFEYTGQPIYVIPGTNTFFIRTQVGRILIPTFNDDGTLADPDISAQEVGYLLPRVVLDRTNVRDSEVGIQTGDGIRPNAPQNLDRDQRLELEQYTALLLNGDLQFDGYLELVDGRFDLNQQQYEALVISVLDNDRVAGEITEEQAQGIYYYSDRPLFIKSRNDGTFAVFNRQNYTTLLESEGRTEQEIREIQTPIVTRFDRAHQVRLYNDVLAPTLEPGQGGVDRLLSGLNRGSVRPQDVIDAYEDLAPVPIRTDPITGEGILTTVIAAQTEETAPQQVADREPIDPNYTPYPTITPSAIGLGEAHAIETSRFQPSLEENIQIRGYQNYYESNQSLYVGFREEFKNILPSISGLIGAGISFSFFRARDRGYLGQVLRQNRLLLDIILKQLEDRATELAESFARRREINEELELLENRRRTPARRDRERILNERLRDYNQQLELVEGQIRIGVNPEDRDNLNALRNNILQNIRYNNRQLELYTQETARLTDLQDDIVNLETEIDNLENLLIDTSIERNEINLRLENILNEDYTILQEIQRTLPQILTGYQIGIALGSVLAGYVFPTYIDNDLEESNIADIAKQKSKEAKTIKNKQAEYKKSNTLSKHLPQEHKEKEIEPLEAGPINPPFKSDNLYNKNLVSGQMKISRSKGRPLNLNELRELKSTLNEEELKRFEGKNLFFRTDAKGRQSLDIRDGSPCKMYIKKPIIGIDPNQSKFYL